MMLNKYYYCVVSYISVLFGIFFSSRAQSSQNTLIVTENRVEQPISSVLSSTTVVTRNEIDHWQSKTLVDVLRRLPSVDIAQNGGMGQTASVFIRGTDAKHVLVLIDGVRFNNVGIAGNPSINQFPIALVQSIQYSRGARSAVYGSDAIGGVINIITKRDDIGSKFTAGMGSQGYQNYTGTTSGVISENTRFTAATGYTYNKGADIITNYTGKYQPNSRHYGFMNKSLWLGTEHSFNSQFSGFARIYGYQNRTRYLPYAEGANNTQVVNNRTYDTGLNFHNGLYTSQLIFSYNQTKDHNFNPHSGNYTANSTLDNAKQYNIHWWNNWQREHGAISSGADYQQQRITPGTAMTSKGETLSQTGLYLTAQQRFGKWILEGAARADHYFEFKWHSTWQSGFSWEFIDGYRLVGSYATAYKAPNIGQLYADAPDSFNPEWGMKGNKDLKPEESQQWEVGFEKQQGDLTWLFSSYRNNVYQLIDYRNGANGQPGSYYNVKKAMIKGIEWNGELTTGKLHHQLTYQYVDPRDDETHKRLLRRAKQQVKYQLDWSAFSVDWGLTYQYIGTRDDMKFDAYSTERVKLGGVSLWDTSASYPVDNHLTICGRIANLFDKNYETAYGYRNSGRAFFLTGSYNF